MGVVEEILRHFPEGKIYAIIFPLQGYRDLDIEVVLYSKPPAKRLRFRNYDVWLTSLEMWEKLEKTRSFPGALLSGAYIAYRALRGVALYGKMPSVNIEFKEVDGFGLLLLALKAREKGRNSKANFLLELALNKTFDYRKVDSCNYLLGRREEFKSELGFEVFRRYKSAFLSFPYLSIDLKRKICKSVEKALRGRKNRLSSYVKEAEEILFGKLPEYFEPG